MHDAYSTAIYEPFDESPLVLWGLEHDRCMCCFASAERAAFEFWPGLQTHHLVKRSRRRCDEPWNLLRLCQRCHDLAELHTYRERGIVVPKLPFEICLWVKRDQDYSSWSPLRLGEIYGRQLPRPTPLPEYFVRERERLGLNTKARI